MKEYPLTEGELRDLAKTGFIATAFFSLAAFLVGLGIDISKDLAFAGTVVPPTVSIYWGLLRWVGFVAGGVCIAFGIYFVSQGKGQLNRIMGETEHDD